MKEHKYVKIDKILICEVTKKEMLYQDDFHSIHNILKKNIKTEIKFYFIQEEKSEVEEYILNINDKFLILEEEINNLNIFDFIFFNNILNKEKYNFFYNSGTLEELISVYKRFVNGLKTYRYDMIKHKTFHIKQRRISRKQLEELKMDYDKWTVAQNFFNLDEDGEDE